jgi:hypothetical protein
VVSTLTSPTRMKRHTGEGWGVGERSPSVSRYVVECCVCVTE